MDVGVVTHTVFMELQLYALMYVLVTQLKYVVALMPTMFTWLLQVKQNIKHFILLINFLLFNY